MKYTEAQIKYAAENSISLCGMLRVLGKSPKGGNLNTMKKYLKLYYINTDHFKGQGWGKGETAPHAHTKESFIEEVLCEGGKGWKSSAIKRKLLEWDLIKNVCAICALEPTWFGRVLVLHLDHINGVNNDNRLSNLRLLCPNCDSQTDTYCRSNKPT